MNDGDKKCLKATGLCCGVSWFIIFVSLFAASFKYVSELEYCVRYNTITNVVDDEIWNNGESGTYFMAQAYSFMCFPKTHKRMRLSNGDHPSIDGPTLRVRSKEGLQVTMDLDFEYAIYPDKLVDLYKLLGQKFETEINIAALSALHRASSKFLALDFLSPKRTEIRRAMLNELNRTLSPLYMNVKSLHLFHVSVVSEFQGWIQAIENIKLEQKLKMEDRILQIASQNNLKAKAIIDLHSAREEIIINADKAVSTATFNRVGDLTQSKTSASILQATAKRERELDKIKFEMRLALARENRSLVLKQVKSHQKAELIKFETALLNAKREATVLKLNAEAEAIKIRNLANAEGTVLQAQFAAELEMYLALRNSASFNNTEILQYMWINTHKKMKNMDFFLDYKKVPLVLEGVSV
eukprot:g2397.t1